MLHRKEECGKDISVYEFFFLHSQQCSDACVIFYGNIRFSAPEVLLCECGCVWVYMLWKAFNIALAFPPIMKALIMQGQSSDWQPVIKNPIPGHICAQQRKPRTIYIKSNFSTCWHQQACIWNQNKIIAPAGLVKSIVLDCCIVPLLANEHNRSDMPLLLHCSYYMWGYETYGSHIKIHLLKVQNLIKL